MLPERGDGVEEEIDPLDLDGGGLAGVVGGEPVGDGTRPVRGLDRRLQQRKRHRRRRALHRVFPSSIALPLGAYSMARAGARVRVSLSLLAVDTETRFAALDGGVRRGDVVGGWVYGTAEKEKWRRWRAMEWRGPSRELGPKQNTYFGPSGPNKQSIKRYRPNK